MSRLFVTNREVDFVGDITKELLKDVVGQSIIYYPISEEKTRMNTLYNESSQKIFDTPIEIRALVEYKGETEVTTTKFGIDSIYEMTVFFHKKDLVDRNITVREGDVVQYGERFYEITKLTKPKDIFGQNENIHGIHAECRITREGQFNTAIVTQPSTFSQHRGKFGSEGAHDRRELQEDGVIDSVLTGSINTSPFTV